MKRTTSKKFFKINVEISNICNLQCSFCPEVIRTKKMMSMDLFTKIIEQAAPLTEQVCFHLMGDPLVHPQLKDFIQLCEQKKVKIFFVTNGVLLREDKALLLFSEALQQVNFSLHSFFDNFGDKDPTTYLENIFRFTEKALVERPDLYINYRLWNLNDPRGSLTNNQLMIQLIEKRFQFEFPRELNVRVKKGFRIKNRLYLHFDTEFIWPSMDLPELGTRGTCYGLSSHFGILADGTVVPCCLDKEGVIPLGNLETQNLEEILASPRATQMLQGFKNHQLVEELCRRCQYIQRFQGTPS